MIYDLSIVIKAQEEGDKNLILNRLNAELRKKYSGSERAEFVLFSLVGPVDVKSVEAAAISEIVPADKSEGYCMEFMPYIEFYEEDFPWRYTPLAASGKLKPWLLLLACKDDEFTLTKDNKGYCRVTVDPKGEGFYPSEEEFYKLAHVQVTMPDWVSPNMDPAEYVNENPDDGISRLFCFRQLEAGTQYTMFLVPAFELGRRAGMGESTEGARLDQLAWNAQSSILSFPVYYQWSFKTGGESFLSLARKQYFISDEEFKALPDGLKLDIQETGLKEYRTYEETINEDKILVDMPAALVKHGFDESKLTEEVPKYRIMNRNGVAPVHMTDELKELQLMSPVFNENADDLNDGKTNFSEQEDPWVVPPVYGARHILATREDLDNEKLFLNKLNLRFRNRAAAGLGVSVVKRNQEVFTNRAWGMIDEINALNQRIREYYEACQTNGASSKKATSLQNYVFRPHASGLQADAAIRVANAQSGAKINAVDLAMDIANPFSGLSVRSSVLQPLERGTGITVDELDVVSNRKYWKQHWAEIVQKSAGYRFLTGKKEKESLQDPFFDGEIDERFNFLRNVFTIDYPKITLDGKTKSINGANKDNRGELLHFQCKYGPKGLPDLRTAYCTFPDSGWFFSWLNIDGSGKYKPTMELLSNLLDHAEEVYEERWVSNLGTEGDGILRDKCLPVLGAVRTAENDKQVGEAVLMKNAAYGVFRDEYPSGFRVQYKDVSHGNEYSLCFLPEDRMEEANWAFTSCYPSGWQIELQKNPDSELPHSYIPVKDHYIPFNWKLSGGAEFVMAYVRTHPVTVSPRYSVLKDAYERLCQMTADVRGKGYVWTLDKVTRSVSLFVQKNPPKGQMDSFGISYPISDKFVYLVCCFHADNGKYYTYTYAFSPSTDLLSKYADADHVRIDPFLDIIENILTKLEWLEEVIWKPTFVRFGESILEKLPIVSADMIGKVWSDGGKYDQMMNYFDRVVGKDAEEGKTLEESEKGSVRLFREHFIAAGILPDPDAEPKPEITSEDVSEEPPKLIDADKENEKRLLEIANQFADRGMTLDLSVSNFDGKYPIMAYPIFPDPTSFYLRELSERFILPSVDKLKMNSISCFVTNPIFEEAFLAGMNTEMGRELLWREYPTDERGSYFRKFWDQVELPSDFKDGYFDVKYLHNWKKRLGANHEDGKGQLVVFIIKSELMMQYPQTGITLSTPKNNILEVALVPTMTGWLADDTYMAGFDISKLSSTKDLYLTFTETDKSQRFNQQPLTDKDVAGDLSSVFAVKHKNDGTVWGCGVKSDYLVVNDLHLDDDEPTATSGTGTGLGAAVKPKPDGRLNPQNPDLRGVQPELKR